MPAGWQVGSELNDKSEFRNRRCRRHNQCRGLAGLLEDGSIVENSSATGTVSATADDGNVGGLAGRALNSAIKASFATGDIVATTNAGGLAGRV